MSDLNITKKHAEEPRPLLSLNTQDDKQHDKKQNEEEQEALWNRSLEFFQTMNCGTHTR